MQRGFRALLVSFLVISAFPLFSSGEAGASGGDQSDLGNESPNDIDEPNDGSDNNHGADTNKDDEEVVTPGLEGTLDIGDLVVNRESKPSEFKLNNQTKTLKLIEQDSVFLVYETVLSGEIEYFALGFDGEYVDGASASWYNSKNLSGGTDYFISGDLVRPDATPNHIAVYRGEFMVTRAWSEDLRTLRSDMEYRLDFNEASFEGYDIPNQALISMDGEIDGNQISGRVNYTFGTDQFTGGIFGPNGHEIAGGFENGGTSVIFYGAYDQDLSDAVSN